jgi:Nucleoside-diphosphate-sugar epimerases
LIRVILTGASGFIGSNFMNNLNSAYTIVPISLRAHSPSDVQFEKGDVVVHMAGEGRQLAKKDESEYDRINYALTKELCEHAKVSNIDQFIYLSSIKVYGENNIDVWNEKSAVDPVSSYGKSKVKAEKFLMSQSSDSFQVAIIRLPLVYGPGVKGNVLKLLNAVYKNRRLPLKNITNQRSFLFVDNLIELIDKVIQKKCEGVFIAMDEHPLSTSLFIEYIYNAMNVGERKWFEIPPLFQWFMRIVKPEVHRRLYGDLQFDGSDTKSRLNVSPRYSTAQGVDKMVKWYLNSKSSLG